VLGQDIFRIVFSVKIPGIKKDLQPGFCEITSGGWLEATKIDVQQLRTKGILLF